jgi:hypothetical protein
MREPRAATFGGVNAEEEEDADPRGRWCWHGKNGMREPGRSAASARRKKGTGEPRRRAGGGVRWRAQEEAVAGAGVVARGRVWWWVGVTFIWGSWAR